MPQSALSVQLYTLRDFLKTPAEIAATLRRVKKIGYNAVELAGLGTIAPAELARMLNGEGLVCSGAHVLFETMQADAQRVIGDHRIWNCTYIAVPGFWGKGAGDFSRFIKEYNALAGIFNEAGIRIGYHNHNHELVRHGGQTLLAKLVEKLDPSIWFEIDTYWIAHGGGDPIQWIENVAERIPCVHLKDMSINAELVQQMAEVGEGNLNWSGILPACRRAGTRWFVVEQDECQRDPFDCITTSFNNLREMGLE